MKNVYDLQKEWKREIPGVGGKEFDLPLRTADVRENETVTFTRSFLIPESDDGSAVLLVTDGLSGRAEILLDDDEVCVHDGLFAPFAADLSPYVKKGRRQTLTLRVLPRRTPDGEFVFGGARLVSTGKSRFDRTVPGAAPLRVRAVFTKDGVSLRAEADLANPNNYDILVFRLTDPKGRVVETRSEKPTQPQTVFSLPAPDLWEGAHDAGIYRLDAALRRDAAVLDTETITFGIRQTQLGEEGLFRLNGLKLPLNGVCLRPASSDPADADLLTELDANCVLTGSLSPDEAGLFAFDAAGIITVFSIPPEIAENEEELAGTLRRLHKHPAVCFVYCPTREISLLKRFTSTVKKYAPDLFTVGDCDLLHEDSLADAVPDLLRLNVDAAGDSAAFLELENAVASLLREHPDYRFLVFADAPECIFDRHSVHAVRPDCSQEYFSMWHEKIWHIFYNKKGVVAYVAGYLADKTDKADRTGLVTADRESRKDAFWFYRSQFSAEGFVKLCSSERTSVTKKYVDVKCYTNTPPIRMTVNGKTRKKLRCDALSESVYVFRDVKLRRKNNTIVITAASGTDSEVLFRSKSKLSKE